MKLSVFVGLAFLLAFVSLCESSKTSKRCTWSLLKATRACKLSCKVLGHTTGVCTPEEFCFCSGEEYDFISDVGDWFKENLSIDELSDNLSQIYNKVKDEIGDFSWLEDITVSKCQIGQEFCRRACHSVGSVDGVCNADFTDCDCTDDKVSFEQFRKCASASVCRVYCQSKGNRHGECRGETGWDCECSGKKEEEDTTTTESVVSPRSPLDQTDNDYSDDAILFDARK